MTTHHPDHHRRHGRRAGAPPTGTEGADDGPASRDPPAQGGGRRPRPAASGGRRRRPAPMTAEDERQFARAVIARVLEAHAAKEIAAGRTPPSVTEDAELAEGIHAALYGVGRLQPLLDDPEVENIDINGCDSVFVGYANGRGEALPAGRRDRRGADRARAGARRLLVDHQPSVRHRQPAARPAPARRQPAVGGDGRVPAAVAVDPPRAASTAPVLDMLVANGSMSTGARRLPVGGGRRPQEHHDRGRHQRREDHAAARAGQRDSAAGAADHRRAGAGAGARRVRGPAPQRRRVRGAAAQLRGPGRDPR